MTENKIQYNYTIIIPHYNIPALLRRCINSIPVREDIQIIVVDDCSPNTNDLVKLISELKQYHIEYYSTPVGGSAGRARNVGIEHAKGKWVTFVDADDLLSTDCNKLLNDNINCDADVMFFPSTSVMCDDISIKSDRNIFDYHFKEYFRSGNEFPLRFEFDAPWGKFVKKSLIDKYNIRFDEIRYSNDTFFSACIGQYAGKIHVSKDVLYIVTERPGSLTSAKMKSIEEWKIRYNSALRVQRFFDENSIKYRRYAFADFLYIMWSRDKKLFSQEILSLNFKNKIRFIYYCIRNLISK